MFDIDPRLLLGAFLIVVLLAGASVPLPAGGSPPLPTAGTGPSGKFTIVWSNETTYGPPALANASAVWEGSSGYALLFGGQEPGGLLSNSTWLWADSMQPTWFNDSAGGVAPSARSLASLAWDSENGYALLFGGRQGTRALGDTWGFHPSTFWQYLFPSVSPSPRWGSALVDDPTLGSVLLFGGQNSTSFFNDTWSFRLGTWKALTPRRSPSPRAEAAVAYDPETASVYLFGGRGPTGPLGDLWEFSNGTWSELSPGGVGGPTPRYAADLLVTGDGRLVLVGGETSQGPVADFWIWQDSRWWNESANATGFPPTAGAAAVPSGDLGANFYWVFGGWPFRGPDLETWLLYLPDGGTPGNLGVQIRATPSQGSAPLSVTFSAQVSGGNPPYSYLWNFGDGSSGSTLAQPVHVFERPQQYQVSLTVRDSLGHTATATLYVSVFAAPAGGPPRTWEESLGLPLLFALIGIGIGGGVVWPLLQVLDSRRSARRLWRGELRDIRRSWARNRSPWREAVRMAPPGERVRSLLRWWKGRRPTGELQPPWGRRALGLLQYAARRVVLAIGQLVLVVAVIFLLGTVIPAEFSTTAPPPSGPPLTIWANYLHQFASFVVNLLTGNWGFTSAGGEGLPGAPMPWTQYVLYHLPPSFEVGGVAFLLSLAVAYPLGLWSGWRRGRGVDQTTRALSLVGLFLPVYVLILSLIGLLYLPYYQALGTPPFGNLPLDTWFDQNMGGVPSWIGIGGNTSPTGFPVIDAALHGAWALDLVLWLEVLLPASLLALVFSGIFLRYLRLATAEVQDSLQTSLLRARGLREHDILWKHTSRRVLPLYVAVFGQTFPVFVLVQAVTEVVFNFHGLGYALLVEATTGFKVGIVVNAATPVGNILQVFLVILAGLLIGGTTVADIVSKALDPRSYSARGGGAELTGPRGGWRESLRRGFRKRPLPPSILGRPMSEVTTQRLRAARRHGWLAVRRWWTGPSLAAGTLLLGLFAALAVDAVLRFGSSVGNLPVDPSVAYALGPPSPPTLNLFPWYPGPHPLGETGLLGQDVWEGLLKGTPWDLLIVVSVLLPSLFIGLLVGGYAGLRGGRVDDLLMLIGDTFLSIPAFVMVVLVADGLFSGTITGLPATWKPVGFGLSLVAVLWAPYARSVRSRARAVSQESYVEASRAGGAGPWRLLWRHVLPNSVSPALSEVPVTVSTILFLMALLQYAALALPGLSLSAASLFSNVNFPEWTWILATGASAWQPPQTGADPWWGYIFPALWILLFGIAVILFCDGLRDYLSPTSR